MANLLDTASHQQRWTTFVAALKKTLLAQTLQEPGPFTIFAPTDDAFSNLPEGTVNRLLADEAKLTAILAYHIVPGRFTHDDSARLSSSVTTLEGGDLRVSNRNGHLTVNGSHVGKDDVLAENGVLHTIDQVLIPLDDLGNVRLEFSELNVVAPDAMVIIEDEEDDEARG
jgi:uncharacterized surface protein with fasciclin (FAS1) repeats